ncbi:MAG TPA: hypothetical protein VEB19_08420 [Gemmatimonadaceae bacterium]|nr:hypothetical protein [Gemmatimonadaceae bacterium]
MNRRAIILMLIGAIASFAGFAATSVLWQRRCTGAGGAWDQAARLCRLESGESIRIGAATDILAGIFVAAVLGFMLFRMLTFTARRMSQR